MLQVPTAQDRWFAEFQPRSARDASLLAEFGGAARAALTGPSIRFLCVGGSLAPGVVSSIKMQLPADLCIVCLLMC